MVYDSWEDVAFNRDVSSKKALFQAFYSGVILFRKRANGKVFLNELSKNSIPFYMYSLLLF